MSDPTILKPESCRLCFSKLTTRDVVGEYVYGGSPHQKFYVCPHCDVAFLYPPLSEEDEKRFYSKEFEKFMEERAGADFDWSGPEAHIRSNEKQYKRRYPFFSKCLKPGMRVMEIGCSSGFMLLPLKEWGADVVGVEPSGGFTGFLKDKGVPVLPSLDEVRKKYDCGSFDLILHFFVLEHVRNPVGFLLEAFEHLNSKGCMVFEVPNRNDPLISIYNISAFQKFYWSVAHNYYFNKSSLEFVVKQITGNFEIINEQRYDISNHMTWALEGKPGGQSYFSSFFTKEAEAAYRESMIRTGYCDTLVCRMYKT